MIPKGLYLWVLFLSSQNFNKTAVNFRHYPEQQGASGQQQTKPAYFFFLEPLVSGFLCFMAIFILSF